MRALTTVAATLSLLTGIAWAQALRFDFSPSPLTRFGKEVAPYWPEPRERGFMLVSGKGLKVTAARNYARPGDRWIEVRLRLDGRPVATLGRTSLRAKLYPVGGDTPVAEATTVPKTLDGSLWVDLRRHNLDAADLRLDLLEHGRRSATARLLLAAQAPERPLAAGRRIPVRLDVPEGIPTDKPRQVTFGAPFGPGVLWDAGGIRLVDGAGRETPHQAEVVARWGPEGSVKWVRFDARVVPKNGCFVQVTPPTRAARPSPAVTVKEQEGRVVVDTGVARYVLAEGPSPIEEVYLGRRRVATAKGARGLYVVDQRGRLASASALGETMAVEARGPVAACVRFEGWYATPGGEKLARHITRLRFRAGQPGASVTHTLTLTRDTNKVWFKEIGWELRADAGAAPKALFADRREDWRSVRTVPLVGAAGATMFQDRHFFFAHGKNHFSINTLTSGGATKPLHEGKECGDWAALQGGSGGLAIVCKDAARQHPKEFEIRPDRVILRLFSNRAGEELDFRSPTLVKKWGLENWYNATHGRGRRKKGFVEKVAKLPSNAIGWAKTHELLFLPLAPATPRNEIAEAARLRATPVYAMADPWAIYESRAMGPIYPADPKRFPVLEKAVMAAFRHFTKLDEEWGEHGFVDYFAGPHLQYGRYDKGTYVGMFRYAYITYTFRSDLWILYARTGERAVRAFAEGTNRTLADGTLAHWDGKATFRGMHRVKPGLAFGLPYYWGERLNLEISSSTNHNNLLNFYYLTGDRRAADCMREYIAGVKRAWKPLGAAKTWRPLMLFRLLTRAYTFDYDPEIRAIAAETYNRFADDDTALGLTKERPYKSTSYKTNVDNRAIIEAWQVFGEERYRRLAHRLAEYWWQLLGTKPVIYTNPQPRIGSFLYNETGKPVYAELLALQLRRLAHTYDPKTKGIRAGVRLAAHSCAFYFEGVAYALDVVTRAGADKKHLTSWLGYDDMGFETSVIARKGGDETINLQANVVAGDTRSEGIGGIRIVPLAPKTMSGLNVVRVSERGMDFQGYHRGSAKILIPKDSPPGDYEILFTRKGAHFALADRKTPLVLYAPGYWQPTLVATPPLRYYFSVPKGARGAQILFEGSSRLFSPDGKPAFGGRPMHGWVSLPSDKPGVWSFEIVRNMLVRVRNLPPFFAMGDKGRFFVPESKPWSREPLPEAAGKVSRKTLYGEGVVDAPGDKSLLVIGKRQLRLEPGPAHPSGDGGRFLPFKQGTIEFWMKPTWDSVTLYTPEMAKAGRKTTTKFFLRAEMVAPGVRRGAYTMDYTVGGTHKTLRGSLLTNGPAGNLWSRAYRFNTLFDRGKWVHVAWVWGQRDQVGIRLTKNVFQGRVFVNGKAGNWKSFRYADNLPHSPMKVLYLGYPSPGGSISAFVDELRISDVPRYWDDFTPPSRERGTKLDKHTRALFRFNGDVKGVSYGYDGTVPAKLVE